MCMRMYIQMIAHRILENCTNEDTMLLFSIPDNNYMIYVIE